jgi:hypothetical protein
MATANHHATRPTVSLIGALAHPDFRDAMELLRADAHVIVEENVRGLAGHHRGDGRAQSSEQNVPVPLNGNGFANGSKYIDSDLIVVAQSRPGEISLSKVERLRRMAPLAGMVGLLGSWCEGETRTGRPWPGVERIYWYDFPAWWRRQLKLRTAGRCPDWARPFDFGTQRVPRISDCGFRQSLIRNPKSEFRNHQKNSQGVIVLRTGWRDTAAALADIFQRAGYATIWHRLSPSACMVRGVAAGIWDGGQLDDREAHDLAAYCRALARDAAPVIALMDFPRRDRVDYALQLGASAVHGKPWRNNELIAAVEECVIGATLPRAA